MNKVKKAGIVGYLTNLIVDDSIYIAKTTRSDPFGHGGFFCLKKDAN
ncbi:MAG: hypothetical protein UX02_C0006G0009 [Candidatus Moranbacteria bacterium GW2011_GWC1_45_18]|nr:MAG: hypothetical protein UT79_C0001G0009 [Candidatus Moranbacteria bacterium GW2011_GWC2_40_12]KKT32742.1 MAG: hypothetical protein UW19_C0016G0009 [Candidatus Moranbacteria bacterium GW2011_GWF2_44_10]KKT72169.1 MAG: hypothetical protein UW66_C0011G0003 [Candidatus Moranbacteria bacterium GW2011_GWF1_44_4]KKT99130.1 MAG: hypothetical protein UX02_C0006G0009 [Candidatus Moranbacteria bacterium GW2011_GWC1_45_18]